MVFINKKSMSYSSTLSRR